MRVFNIFLFLFLGNLIINILSTEILKKNGSIKTKDEFVFESKEFSIGDKMYFTIKSEYDCDDYLYYEYFDDSDDINYNFNPIKKIKYNSQSRTKVNGKIKSLTRQFTLEKKSADLNNLNGDYLYLKYKCYGSGSIEITNKEKGDSNNSIVIAIVFVIFFAIIFGIIIWCYCRRREKRMAMQNNYSNSYYPQMPVYPGISVGPQMQGVMPGPQMQGVMPVGPQMQGFPQIPIDAQIPIEPQYANQAIVYQAPNPNPAFHGDPNNIKHKKKKKIKVIEKGPIDQNTSNREVDLKPKI